MASTYAARIARYQAQGMTAQQARARAQGSHGEKHTSVQHIAGRTVVSTKSGQQARLMVGRAAALNRRVSVTVIDKAGNARKILGNTKGHHSPGASANWVKAKMGGSGGSAKGFIASQSGWSDSDELVPPLEVDDIAEIQITVY